MAMSETRKKALAYLRDGKVTVRSALKDDQQRRAALVNADVVGQNSTYLVELRLNGWRCTCKNDGCPHIEAVKLVTGHPSKAAK